MRLTISTNITDHQVTTESHQATTHGNSSCSSFSRVIHFFLWRSAFINCLHLIVKKTSVLDAKEKKDKSVKDKEREEEEEAGEEGLTCMA
jgi:hypothetical protein